MRRVPISSVATVNPGTPPEVLSAPEQLVSFVPMAVVGEDGRLGVSTSRPAREVLKGYSPFRRGDVIVAKITPCLENGKAAHVIDLPHEFGFGSTEFHVLRPGPDVDARYLFFAVWNPAFRELAKRSMTGSAGQQRAPAHVFDRFHIPLPTLTEQRRIVDLLTDADALRRKRRESLKLLDDLLRSAFFELFGDPVTNPHAWDACSFRDIMVGTPTNGLYRPASDYGAGVPIVRIDSMQLGEIEMESLRRVTISGDVTKRFQIVEGDILVNRVNAIDHLGKCACVPALVEPTVFESNMMRVSVDRTRVDPTFVVTQLQSGFVRRQILAFAKDAVNQSSINQRDVSALRLLLPPLSRQQTFAASAASIRSNRRVIDAGADQSDKLFSSLLQSSFAGG